VGVTIDKIDLKKLMV